MTWDFDPFLINHALNLVGSIRLTLDSSHSVLVLIHIGFISYVKMSSVKSE